MHRLLLPIIMLAFILSACSSGTTELPGAWLGEGKFNAAQGSMDVKAQLEILPDGTYRFLVIEPGILALAGVERGKWSQSGDLLNLTPDPEEQGDDNRSILFRSAPRNFQPKTLRVVGQIKSLELADGPMQVTFTHNPKATASLREAGEL